MRRWLDRDDRRRGKVPGTRNEGDGYEPGTLLSKVTRQLDRIYNSPCRGTNDALAMVLGFEHVELGVHVLRDVANEGENLSDSVVHGGKCSQDVDERMGDRGCFL